MSSSSEKTIMSESLTIRLQNTPLVIAILIFDAITSFMAFILPFFSIVYIGDFSTLIGMALASIYLLRKEKNNRNLIIIRSISLLAIIGGIVVALSLSLVYYLLITAAGFGVSLLQIFLYYVQWTVIVTLVTGCLTFGVFMLSRRIMEDKRQFH